LSAEAPTLLIGSKAMAETVPIPMPAALKGKTDAPLIKSRLVSLLLIFRLVRSRRQSGPEAKAVGIGSVR
jgi:hypothetical protein